MQPPRLPDRMQSFELARRPGGFDVLRRIKWTIGARFGTDLQWRTRFQIFQTTICNKPLIPMSFWTNEFQENRQNRFTD